MLPNTFGFGCTFVVRTGRPTRTIVDSVAWYRRDGPSLAVARIPPNPGLDSASAIDNCEPSTHDLSVNWRDWPIGQKKWVCQSRQHARSNYAGFWLGPCCSIRPGKLSACQFQDSGGDVTSDHILVARSKIQVSKATFESGLLCSMPV